MAGRNLRGMNSAQVAQSFQQLVDQHLFNNPNGILQSDNSIQAFGVYTIYKDSNCFKIYKNKTLAAETSTAKCALAWCIADKYKVKRLCEDIQRLDLDFSRKQIEIQCYKNIIDSSVPAARKMAVEDKLQESLLRARRTRNQLDKCLNSAKYYQLKGFENETSRLGIKSPSRKISKGI
jgi:3-methyladenine DNA glycosylase AlkC